jgi:aspartyl-tRNA(Asn)/glutamyl-tRNA(Gln) amidotransferase subunit C
MAVTREEVLHVASLARLALDEKSVPRLVHELNGIREHMEVLKKVDTTGVSGAEGVGDAGMPLRVDAGPQYALAHARETFAPEMRDGFFLVPRLATHEDATESLE